MIQEFENEYRLIFTAPPLWMERTASWAKEDDKCCLMASHTLLDKTEDMWYIRKDKSYEEQVENCSPDSVISRMNQIE